MFPDSTIPLNWPSLNKLALALALGLFVGLEREWRGKEAGVRTFGFTALLGCLGGMLGDAYALMSMVLMGLLVVFLNWQRLRTNHTAELTTSAAFLVMGVAGILCGKGQTFIPVVVAVFAAALLAWKEHLAGFAIGLTVVELRSAILLAILTFVIYPVLPVKAIDPWGLVEPRTTWTTIILIAGLGFVNYLLWKMYGARSIGLTGFLGGLVNSTVAVTELATRAREFGASIISNVYSGVIYSTIAMLLRNGVLLAILAPKTLPFSALPLSLMVGAGVLMAALSLNRREKEDGSAPVPELKLESPFSLQSALKFGLVFLVLRIAGTLAQRFAGPFGFYAVSLAGGLVSSASSVASAASLASQGHLPPLVAANGAIIASLASVMVNLPLVARISRQPKLTGMLSRALILVVVLGLAGCVAEGYFFASSADSADTTVESSATPADQSSSGNPIPEPTKSR